MYEKTGVDSIAKHIHLEAERCMYEGGTQDIYYKNAYHLRHSGVNQTNIPQPPNELRLIILFQSRALRIYYERTKGNKGVSL